MHHSSLTAWSILLLFLLVAALLGLFPGDRLLAQEPKAASPHTKNKHEAARGMLERFHETDFDEAQRGFIASLEDVEFPREDGRGTAYSIEKLEFLEKEAPPTVHPALWRQAQLNALHHGLFKVTEGVYQVRSFDLANMTLIRGQRGWIVVDPLTTLETARAALDLANRELGSREISAVVVTHSHLDHFGGLGLVTQEQIRNGEVRLIAPQGLTQEALSENVLLGNVMVRRAEYMFGSGLERSPKGFVGAGLGADLAHGQSSLLPVTDPIHKPLTEMTVDGVEMVFLNVPGAEAPVEILFYLPAQKALCMAEITSRTLHNVYTLRGAKTRDALVWASHIHRTLELFGDKSSVLFASHHWPIWGQEALITFLEKQRDLYKFMHDQTIRWANHGFSPVEIAEFLRRPEGLKPFYNLDHYGTLSHNIRAIYNTYLGFFDGRPARLNPLPPTEAGRKYIDFMGGSDSVLQKAQRSFDAGDYRWVATVLDHLLSAEPENSEARALQADTLEQLGYQAHAATWRNIYLSGAHELRHGIPIQRPTELSRLLLAAPVEKVFEALAVRLDPEKAGERTWNIQITFLDLEKTFLLSIKNGVFHAFEKPSPSEAPLRLMLSSIDFKRLILGKIDPVDLIDEQRLSLVGDPSIWFAVMGFFDAFDPRFPLAAPHPTKGASLEP